MKNKIISLVSLSFLLSACGTTIPYTSATYDDPAYYHPAEGSLVAQNQESVASDQNLKSLKEKTRKVIFIDENDEKTTITSNSSKNDTVAVYVNLGDYESFEELLNKFDSPEYNVNIIIADNWGSQYDNSYYGWNYPFNYYGYYGYYGYGYYNWFPYYMGSWFNPYLYGTLQYYDYWDYYMYGMPYYGWYGDLYGWNGWYGWYGNDHNNNYTFYGRRGSDVRIADGASSGGSYTRRANTVLEQIRGNNTSDKNINVQRSESVYRRGSANTDRNSISRNANGVIYNDVTTRTSTSSGQRYTGTSYTRASQTPGSSSATKNVPTRTSSFRASSSQSTGSGSSNQSTQYYRSAGSNSSSRSSNSNNSSNIQSSQSYSTSASRSAGSYQSSGGSSSSGGQRSSSNSGSSYRR